MVLNIEDQADKIHMIIDDLEKFTKELGKYANLGYTNKQENEEGCLDIFHNEQASKTSFHVYFYQCQISREEAVKFSTEFKRRHLGEFLYDGGVYKNVGKQQK
jgi:hypothetical protein